MSTRLLQSLGFPHIKADVVCDHGGDLVPRLQRSGSSSSCSRSRRSLRSEGRSLSAAGYRLAIARSEVGVASSRNSHTSTATHRLTIACAGLSECKWGFYDPKSDSESSETDAKGIVSTVRVDDGVPSGGWRALALVLLDAVED